MQGNPVNEKHVCPCSPEPSLAFSRRRPNDCVWESAALSEFSHGHACVTQFIGKSAVDQRPERQPFRPRTKQRWPEPFRDGAAS